MKIGIVSDIHCNVAGLEQALALMGEVDGLICAGDAIFQYRFSNDVTRILRARNAWTIQGNHEETFFEYNLDRARQDPAIEQDLLEWLAARPLTLRLRLDGREILVVHGSPWEPRHEYLYPTSPSLSRFQEYDADIVIYGHTHHQLARWIGGTLVINPGSAGDARDARNGYQLSCAILDTAAEEVQFADYPDPSRVDARSTRS